MSSKNALSPPFASIEEAILLRPNERATQQIRTAWDTFVASVPLPALWVTAHVDLSRTDYGALTELKRQLASCSSVDAEANQYRIFLQKFLIKLNWKMLHSKTHEKCFSFRGSLECNAGDSSGNALHYHFYLWDPNGSFARDPSFLNTTRQTLLNLWCKHVNARDTERYKPIDIQIVPDRVNAKHIAQYTNKAVFAPNSFKLFDDWTTSRR